MKLKTKNIYISQKAFFDVFLTKEIDNIRTTLN